jgi:hypothetical protein
MLAVLVYTHLPETSKQARYQDSRTFRLVRNGGRPDSRTFGLTDSKASKLSLYLIHVCDCGY